MIGRTPLEAALAAFGWAEVEGTRGLSVWERAGYQVVAPRSLTARDHQDVTRESLEIVRAASPGEWDEFCIATGYPTFDQTRLRARPDSDVHTLLFADARLAIDGFWSALIASARATKRRQPFLRNMGEEIVKRYSASAQMLAPSAGSFVVTVLAETIGEHAVGDGMAGPLPTRDRLINETLMSAIGATISGAQDYRNSNRLDRLMEAVSHGLSVELAKSLIQVVQAVGTVELRHRPAILGPEWGRGATSVTVSSDVVRPLEQFVVSLSTSDPRQATVTGSVRQLVDSGSGPFTVELRVASGAPVNRIKLRGETEDEREIIANAFRRQVLVTVAGQLAQEGQTTWLYGTRIRLTDEPAQLFE